MPFESYDPDGDLRHEVARRPSPRCYMRPAPSEAVSARIDTQNIALVLALGLIWCAAAFVIVGNGWSF
jgi:hypothetical protein